MTPITRLVAIIAGLLCGTLIVGRLVEALTAENRRLLSAQVAVSPRDFGVLAAQQDAHEASPDAFERLMKDKLPDLDHHLEALRGNDDNEPEPSHPHGL